MAKENEIPVMWHACRRRDLAAILAEGLRPEASRSRSSAVYLADCRFAAENYSGFDPEAEWVALEVDGSALDPSLLAPDDYELPDLLEGMGDDEAEELGVEACADPGSLDWRMSLRICSQVRYFGVVPPSAITVHEFKSWRGPSA